MYPSDCQHYESSTSLGTSQTKFQMEAFHSHRMNYQYVTEYHWNLGGLYVVCSFRDADPAIVETSRFGTLAVRNMSYATFLSK